ncbi:unnamed protein product [Bursaphelenchus xylophilus]|uniref:(pine wood nematode) hypothetical protein n=1 Tax=Bursaphelenchus xylophilus TaxID=6326 RepID=A0A1I7SLU3_BURXY|nr:unnamed protein product [Bursaphelenchus xylophilus]CAG9129842.1 unnamed protein product [Bursaphelenchus xylophilus]
MCVSRIAQILYGVATFVAISLILTSALTPGWKKIQVPGSTKEINTGLFKFACSAPENSTMDETTNDTDKDEDLSKYCENWWKNQPTWEKVVIGCMLAALGIHLLALILNIVTCCCVCGREYLLRLLGVLSFMAFILLVTSLTIFGIRNKDDLGGSPKNFDKNEISYSFYLGVAAALLSLINAILGASSASCAKLGCCF